MRTMGEALANTTMPSPLGDLTIVSRADVMTGLYFSNHWYRPDPRSFGAESDIPLSAGGDELQRKVWNLVRQVACGETSTYGRLAQEKRTVDRPSRLF